MPSSGRVHGGDAAGGISGPLPCSLRRGGGRPDWLLRPGRNLQRGHRPEERQPDRGHDCGHGAAPGEPGEGNPEGIFRQERGGRLRLCLSVSRHEQSPAGGGAGDTHGG